MDYEIPEEPKVSLKQDVTPLARRVPVGRIAECYNRDGRAFVKKVERGNPPDDPTHYYVDGGGYAISADILEQLKKHGVEWVFTYEEDTGLVLEHHISAYTDDVDNGIYGNDEQYCAPESEAEYRWEDLGEDLYTNDSFWSQT